MKIEDIIEKFYKVQSVTGLRPKVLKISKKNYDKLVTVLKTMPSTYSGDSLNSMLRNEVFGMRVIHDDREILNMDEFMNCECEKCNGQYMQVDPVNCGCTECICGEYRPAIDEEDYQFHNSDS